MTTRGRRGVRADDVTESVGPDVTPLPSAHFLGAAPLGVSGCHQKNHDVPQEESMKRQTSRAEELVAPFWLWKKRGGEMKRRSRYNLQKHGGNISVPTS